MMSRLSRRRRKDHWFAAVALVLLASGGCDELLIEPDQGLARLSVSYSLTIAAASSSAGPVEALSQVDDIQVRVTPSGQSAPILDASVGFSTGSGLVSLDPLSVPIEADGSFLLEVSLSWQSQLLFVATGSVQLATGETTQVDLIASSIPSQVVAGPEPAMVGVGQSTQLMADVLLATGDVDPAIGVSWSTLDPGVATVSASGVVSGAEVGTARIVAEATVTVDRGTRAPLIVSVSDTIMVQVIASPPDAAFAYVTNELSNNVSVIELATNTVVATIAVGEEPQGITIRPDGAFAYVANGLSNNVSVIDLATNTVTATIAVGDEPVLIAIRPDGAFAYVTNRLSDNVSVIDLATSTVAATVAVGLFPVGIAITPDGAFAYVANEDADNVSVIDLAADTVTATVAVGDTPILIAIRPDGAFAYVSNELDHNVSVIDLATNTVTATIALGGEPGGITITPDGAFAYISRPLDDDVSVIDLATNIVTATIAVGDEPLLIAITPDGAFAYVTNQLSNDVSVIDLATNTVTTTVGVGDAPIGIAITPSRSLPLTATETIFNFDLSSLLPGPPYTNIQVLVLFEASDPVSGPDVLVTTMYGDLDGADLLQTRNDTDFITEGGTVYGLTTANPLFNPMYDGVFSIGLTLTSGTASLKSFTACGVIFPNPAGPCSTIPGGG